MCFRREVFNSVGVFNTGVGRTDNHLPLGCEDTELCVRARKLDAGADFIFEPRALVWHKIPAKRLTYRYFWLRCYAENYQRPTYPPCSPRSTFCRWNGGTYWRCSHVVSRVA